MSTLSKGHIAIVGQFGIVRVVSLGRSGSFESWMLICPRGRVVECRTGKSFPSYTLVAVRSFEFVELRLICIVGRMIMRCCPSDRLRDERWALFGEGSRRGETP